MKEKNDWWKELEHSTGAQEAYRIKQKGEEKPSRVRALIKGTSRKELFLLSEILRRPY